MTRGILDRVFGRGVAGADRSDGESGLRRQCEPAVEDLRAVCETADGAELLAEALSAPPTDTAVARETARATRAAGETATTFVGAHGVAAEAAVSAAFAELRAELGDHDAIDSVEADLSALLGDVFASASAGAGPVETTVAADGGPASGTGESTRADGGARADTDADTAGLETPDGPPALLGPDGSLGAEAVLDHLGAAAFVLDAAGDVVVWNEAIEELCGVSREEAAEYEMASQAFYHDGRRSQTLADKVLDAPESADEEFGVPRVEDYDFTLYRDESTMTDAAGETRHISFSAAPLYEDGDLVGVVEMVHDQTDVVRRRDRTAALITELKRTMDAVRGGDYDARASFEAEGYVDADLLSTVDTLNDLAEQFGMVATHVTDEVDELVEATESIDDTARSIDDRAGEQTETMAQLSSEIATLSATVEEVAASASQVDATSSEAVDLARDGHDSAREAVDLMSDVEDAADTVTDDVTRLQERVDEIDDIAAVINDIADQTNILALNASIEAARAGEAGEGFAVVADEVKQLAEESQQNAAEIEALIADIEADTTETVESLDRTTGRITEVIDQVQDAMTKLSDIVDAVSEASEGIQEVADATDDQAASTEEVASMVDEAAAMADDIAADIGAITEATREQQRRADSVRESIDEHTF